MTLSKKYKTILIDPPWPQSMTGTWKARHKRRHKLPYSSLSINEIRNLPIEKLAECGCHIWLWTTNQFLEQGFQLLRGWGFTYLAPITWVKPNGLGSWFIHRTQVLLFGYYKKCVFENERYKPTVIFADTPIRHSRKPKAAYDLIESVSDQPRLELFARPHSPMFPKLPNWDVWGNEMPENDIDFP